MSKSEKALKRKLDTEFSKFIREIGICEWCGKTTNLQCCHIFSRRFLVTRWNPLNAMCLCAGCHRRGHDQPVEFAEFTKAYLGEEIYNELRRIAKTKKVKIDRQELLNEIRSRKPPYCHS